MLDVRQNFPIFHHHPELVYLDSAATTQKPKPVIQAVVDFYEQSNANIHRGLYPLSVVATELYEASREIVAHFIQATSSKEVIFTKSATDSLNLIAFIISREWRSGENILLSEAEHHANLVPWQQLKAERGIEIRFVKIKETGELDLADLEEKIDQQTVAVSLSHCSNVLGTILPASEVKKIIQKEGSQALFILDASQSAPHTPLSVSDLGCDFLVFSGHKLYAPSGVGILWGKQELLEKLPPYQTGGDMIKTVTQEAATWNTLPWKYEAGTPAIEAAVGLGAAITYMQKVGMPHIAEHTAQLSEYAQNALKKIPEVRLISAPSLQSGIITFIVNNIHPHDLASLLGEKEICIRAGHHCAAPLHTLLNIPASNRISFGLYNTFKDIDHFISALSEIIQEIQDV